MHRYECEYTENGKIKIGFICQICQNDKKDKGETVKKVKNAN